MAPMDDPETGNDARSARPTLEYRVEALEAVVVELMALAVREEPRLRPVILKTLMGTMRSIDLTDHGEDEVPDREYEAKSPAGKAVEFIKEEFMRNS